jgi:hypothetical protein
MSKVEGLNGSEKGKRRFYHGGTEGRRRRDRGSRLQSYAGIRPEAASPLSCGEKGDDLELRTLNLEL